MANEQQAVAAAGFARETAVPLPRVGLGSGTAAPRPIRTERDVPAVETRPAEETSQVDPKILRRQVDETRKLAESLNLRLRFGVRETTGDFYLQLLDSRNQVIKTVPMEALLDLRERLHEQLGIYLDEEV